MNFICNLYLNCDSLVYSTRFTKDGKYCLSCCDDKSVRLWNPYKSGFDQTDDALALLIKRYTGPHSYEILDVDVTEDNNRLVTGGGDKTGFVWDVTTGNVVRRLQGHEGRINSVKFAGHGINGGMSVVLTASYDQTVRIWDCRGHDRRPVQILDEARDSVSSLALVPSQNGEFIAGSIDGIARLYDIRAGCYHENAAGSAITHITTSNDGLCLLATCMGNKPTIKSRYDLGKHEDETNGPASWPGYVRLFEKNTGEHLMDYVCTSREVPLPLPTPTTGEQGHSNTNAPTRAVSIPAWTTGICTTTAPAAAAAAAAAGSTATATTTQPPLSRRHCEYRHYDYKTESTFYSHESATGSYSSSDGGGSYSDSLCVVSGSEDGSIFLWDMIGQQQQSLQHSLQHQDQQQYGRDHQGSTAATAAPRAQEGHEEGLNASPVYTIPRLPRATHGTTTSNSRGSSSSSSRGNRDGHRRCVSGVACHPTGSPNIFVSSSYDGLCKVWTAVVVDDGENNEND